MDTITGFTQGTLQVERVVLRRAAHGLAELAKTGACLAPAGPACPSGLQSSRWGRGAWVRGAGRARAEFFDALKRVLEVQTGRAQRACRGCSSLGAVCLERPEAAVLRAA